MKISIFQSEKGDCLLLESDDGKLILHDGGMNASYQKHVAPALSRLRSKNRRLDLVYVSHIDQDHIAGVLQLADDLVAWRVFDHQRGLGNTRVEEPGVGRPPEIGAIWHNAFHDQIGKNHGDVADMLAASAEILAAAATAPLLEAAESHRELALSKMEATKLSRRISAAQLGIPLNGPANGKLMFVREGNAPIQLGSLTIHVIGPFKADLEILRDEWNVWLRKERAKIEKWKRQAAAEERELGNAVPELIRSMELAAEEFGDRGNVTPPNLASLMLYVEEPRAGGGRKRFIFTGDGHNADIYRGLQRLGKLDQSGGTGLHVDVLKAQHHGSEHNWHPDFVRNVTADHYVFCGNGEHENPDLGVIRMVLDSRIGKAGLRSTNVEVNRPFKLWFSSGQTVPGQANARAHMAKVERLVTQARATHPQVRFRFIANSSASFSV
jgi:beta-lactamase superfamily II metal-dependent hydrolase